jgi:hypothetical protein
MARMPLLLLALVVGCRHDRVHVGLAVETWTPAPTRIAFRLDLDPPRSGDAPPPPPRFVSSRL